MKAVALALLLAGCAHRTVPAPERPTVEDEIRPMLAAEAPMALGSLAEPDPKTPDSPVVLGALAREVIDRTIRDHVDEIQRCYQAGLMRDPTIAGQIVVKFTIAPEGRVVSASVKSATLEDEAIQTCVVEHFLELRFPEPSGGGIVIVSYPFLFVPSSDP